MNRVIHRFTRAVPHWQPRITPIDLDDATCEQRAALQSTPSNTRISEYVLVLAHDPETLEVRTPLFNAIMYDPGGLSRAEREIGALGASIVNRCIYCAAVHASRHAQLAKSTSVTDELFARGDKAELPPREQAIFDVAVKLSRSPPNVTAADVVRLRGAGLSDGEIADLILSTALFGWANRLMHVLGDPVRKEI